MILYYFKKVSKIFVQIFSLKKALFNFRKIDKVVFVSAASKSHEKSLLQFIDSVAKFECGATLFIYDLGMTTKTLNVINSYKRHFKIDVNLRRFEFKNYPSWVNIKNTNKGEWAWKSLILSSVRDELNDSNVTNNCVLIWNDAGNQLISNIYLLINYIKTYGFYSSSSDGVIEKWCHPLQLKSLKFSDKYLRKPMLNGALIGFYLGSNKAMELLSKWTKYSLIRHVIAPTGSNRSNHRQDQSLLTILAYLKKMAPSKYALRLTDDSILIHQDVEKYL